MKLQTSWLILEHYGYNEKLRINEEHLVDNAIKEKELNEEWEGIELSDLTIEYLVKLYDAYSNSEGTLDETGIDNIFLTTPDGCPWNLPEEVVVNNDGSIDRKTWIGLWQKAFSEDYEKAYELLVYLGYCENFDEAVEVRTGRSQTLLSESKQQVFNCFVIGQQGTGKTSFLEMYLKGKFPESEQDLTEKKSIVVPLEIKNKSKYLVMTEFSEQNLIEDLLDNPRKMRYCDVLCLIHDGSQDSSNYISDISNKLPKRVAKVLIKTKSDTEAKYGVVPTEEVANEIGTSQFIEISNKNLSMVKEAVDLVSNTAMYPVKGLEHSIVETLKEEEAAAKSKQQSKMILLGGATLSILGGLAYALKVYLDVKRK